MSKPAQKGKDNKKQLWKTGQTVKDVIPLHCKNAPRDGRPYKPADQIPPITREQEFEPLPEPEEWPADDPQFHPTGQLFSDDFEWKSVLGQQFFVLRRPTQYLRQTYGIEDSADAPILKPYNRVIDGMENIQREYEFFKEDEYTTVQETPEKIQFMQKQLQLTICETFEREETPDEQERRKKEQLEKILAQMAKDKKKNTKKPEELVEEGPIQIKDVRLSDVQVESNLNADSRWIGSQLQMIKDRDIRDVNTGKALWSKIYPQENGAPVYNPEGRYWVRVYFMGKERKIEVDDRVPCRGNQPMLPQSATPTQLWPIIIAKAIYKLLQFQRISNPSKTLTGDGIVMYSLMGLICESVQVKNITQAEWQMIYEMLSDQHYNRRDVFLSAFTSPSQKPQAPSNTEKKRSREYINEMVKNSKKVVENIEPDEFAQFKSENESPTSAFNQSPMHQQQQQFDQIEEDFSSGLNLKPIEFTLEKFKRRRSERNYQLPSHDETNLIAGYAYPIAELFQNRQFNMVYVQKRSDREMRLRTEYYEICKANIHKMEKTDKLEHRRRKKDIREKLNEEDKRRIELMAQAAIPHKILRIKTSNGQTPSVYCQFSAEEIYIAKKCIVNKLSRPPNYDIPEIKGDDKSMVSQTVGKQNQDETFSVKPLDDFSALPNAAEPFRRDGGGFWVAEKEFIGLFEYIQVCFDPKKLNRSQILNVPINVDHELSTNDQNEMIIIQKDPEQDESSQVLVIVGFQAKYASNKDFDYTVRPYSVLQRFDLELFESVKDYKVLNQYHSGQLIITENKNNIFRLTTFSPLNYTIWLSSTNNIQLSSIYDYLVDFEGYQPKTFQIEYPAISQREYFLFFRFKISAGEGQGEGTSFVFRARSAHDNNMLRFMRLKLCEQPADNQYMLNTIEGVHRNLYETSFVVSGTQRFQIRRGVTYCFLLEGTAPYTIGEGALDVDFLINSAVNIDLLEPVEPIKYIDKYIPTKYGIIFREKIFVNESTLASFYVRLGEVHKQEVQQVQGKAAAPAKGKGEVQQEIVDHELKDKRLFKLELIHNDQVILYQCGYNQAILSNAPLKSTKEEQTQYILQASFDLREWPEAKEHTQDTDLLHWFLSVFSTETVGVVRDTTKEDREKAIKKSWEDKEPGRAERAKKARQKYMIEIKKSQGEQLTEEEIAILAAPRLSRKQRDEEAKQQQQQKGGKAAKKEDKKAAKGAKKEEVQQEQVQHIIEFPKSYQHVNTDIFQFLDHLESERLSEVYATHAGLINIRSEEQKKEIFEAMKLAQEEALSILSRNMQMREELKLYQKDMKDIFLNQYSTWREQFKEGWEQFLQRREALRQQMSAKIRKEKEIIDVCRQDKPVITPEEFEKILQEAQETIPNINMDVIKVAMKQLKNIRLQSLTDKLNNAIQNFEIEIIKSCIETMENNQVEGVDQQMIEKAYEMIEEARSNPNWLAEKQAELKKMGKKGKK